MEVPQRQRISRPPKATDLTYADRRHMRMVAKRLPRLNVGNVHLDHRRSNRCNRVTKRYRSVGESARIEHDTIQTAPVRVLETVNERTLVVALEEFKRHTRKLIPKLGLKIRQGATAVNLRLPLAKHIQVGTVKDQDSHDVGVGLRLSIVTESTVHQTIARHSQEQFPRGAGRLLLHAEWSA